MRKILSWISGIILVLVVGAMIIQAPSWVRADDPSDVPLVIKSSAPTVNDDALDGIKVGTLWLVQSDGSMWMCRSNSPGAASWKQFDSVDLSGTSAYWITADVGTFTAGTATLTTATLTKATISSGTVSGTTIVGSTSTPSFTSGSGFVITGTEANIYLIDPASDVTAMAQSDNCPIGVANAGVTVILPVPTSAISGKELTIINKTGTTPYVIYATGGLPVRTTSGTTNTGLLPDAVGDTLKVIPMYNSAISYYITADRIS